MLMLSCEYNSVIFPCDSVPPTQLLRSSVELQGTITVITLIFSSSLFLLITFSIKWFIWAMQMPGNIVRLSKQLLRVQSYSICNDLILFIAGETN